MVRIPHLHPSSNDALYLVRKNHLQKKRIQVIFFAKQSNLIASFKNFLKNNYRSFNNSQECLEINMLKKFDTQNLQ